MEPIQKGEKQTSLASLEREMVTVGVVWLMVACFCVVVANVWAAGLM